MAKPPQKRTYVTPPGPKTFGTIKLEDQVVHWMAEGLTYGTIRARLAERGLYWEEKNANKKLVNLGKRRGAEIDEIRRSWCADMYQDGLANKDQRVKAEIALAEDLREAIWTGGLDAGGRPKYQVRDLVNLLELIKLETTGPQTGDERRFQILIKTIVQGVPEGKGAAIAVGAEGRLLSPVELSADGAEGAQGPHEFSAQVSPGGGRGQREELPDSEGDGATRALPAGGDSDGPA